MNMCAKGNKPINYSVTVLDHVEDYKWGKYVCLDRISYITYHSDGTMVVFEKWKNAQSVVIVNSTRTNIKQKRAGQIARRIENTNPKNLPKSVFAKHEDKKKTDLEKKKISEAHSKYEKIIKKYERYTIRAFDRRMKESLANDKTIRQISVSSGNSIDTSHMISPRTFVVRRAIFKCVHNHHNVMDVDAVLSVVGDDGKKQTYQISAGYCPQCHTYFIMESTYYKLRNMGILLCRSCDEKSYLKNIHINGMQLAEESILMQYGYNVSQGNDLSERQRQKILAVLIDNNVMTKSEIISYIDFFISQRQSQDRFQMAISKWEMDRDFVERYRVGEFTKFGVNAIYRA